MNHNPPPASPAIPGLQLPDGLQAKLLQYRRLIRWRKAGEALAMGCSVMLFAFLMVFTLDRFLDTPRPLRLLAGTSTLFAMLILAGFWYQWVWLHRDTAQLARRIARRQPQFGDQLLGVIELATHQAEQRRSPVLVAAAIKQVAEQAQQRDFSAAAPPSRRKAWGATAGLLIAMSALLFVMSPAAAGNAWVRCFLPLRHVDRYTFAQLEQLPADLIVPHGEGVMVTLRLRNRSPWQPATANASIGSQPVLTVPLRDDHYPVQLPPLLDDTRLMVRVGDFRQTIEIQPKLRPELRDLKAEIELPEYLQQPKPLVKDARGGILSVVKGSHAEISATASRTLAVARVNQHEVPIRDQRFTAPRTSLTTTMQWTLDWRDEHGLAGREPFALSLETVDDQPPQVTCENLARTNVVLESELLTFLVKANDDFGVSQVGIQWSGFEDSGLPPLEGSRTLSAGAPDAESLTIQGTFSAQSLEIPAQPVRLRAWARDYLPNRPPVYSAPYTVFVLTPEQHAVWISEQLSRWHRQALEVRDRELQLFQTNMELRAMSAPQRQTAETQRMLQRQAQSERANSDRLANLTGTGNALLQQAMRNSEIGVGHLDRWAEMLQVLQEIAEQRMPSVADLLEQSVQRQTTSKGDTAPTDAAKPTGPTVGNVRTTNHAGLGSETEGASDSDPAEMPPPVPALVDIESSQQPVDVDDQPQESGDDSEQPSKPSLGLPQTMLVGGVAAQDEDENELGDAPDDALEQAVYEQEDLLAEYEKVADELNQVLGNLEGSTLVKRLKAASREQSLIAGGLTAELSQTFGQSHVPETLETMLGGLKNRQQDSVRDISLIMDDMQAYFERRRLNQFKLILDEMRQQDIVGSLRSVATDLVTRQAISVAQCEFWSDVLDRWAEDLVDPASSGSCPGGKSQDSLPPSVVLEVMQILEAEVNLREETRVAQQAKPAVPTDDHQQEAERLSGLQQELAGRLDAVIQKIEMLPEGSERFASDLQLLFSVLPVMDQAATILADGETGAVAIAAETEVIELLLQSSRINPDGGGGGGGSAPGGGGTGTTSDTALALVGRGVNAKEQRSEQSISQVTGELATGYPEEFREGLDRYFNQLEKVQ